MNRNCANGCEKDVRKSLHPGGTGASVAFEALARVVLLLKDTAVCIPLSLVVAEPPTGAGQQVEVADREIQVRPALGVEEDEGGGQDRRDLRREREE